MVVVPGRMLDTRRYLVREKLTIECSPKLAPGGDMERIALVCIQLTAMCLFVAESELKMWRVSSGTSPQHVQRPSRLHLYAKAIA